MLPDDSALPDHDFQIVLEHAKKSLLGANAIGRYPTQIPDIMSFAKITVSHDHQVHEGLYARFKRGAGDLVKKAMSKLLGFLDVIGRIAYIDRSVIESRQNFLKLHETGHAVIPHQKKMYAFIEDCERTISPEISDHFDREANAFASEVLFQLDGFMSEAQDSAFNIQVPLKLGKKYGSSAYAAIRRYVSRNSKICCVLVFNPPKLVVEKGFTASLRRFIESSEYRKIIGEKKWPDELSANDEIGSIFPSGSKGMSRPRPYRIQDKNGINHEFIAEAFKTPFQVFVLMHSVKTLTGVSIVRP